MGMVKVLGEIWRAESDVVIEAGAGIRVKKVIGNHLVVAPKTEPKQ
jgi:membrane protein implicated in regulation of membrane protease activity